MHAPVCVLVCVCTVLLNELVHLPPFFFNLGLGFQTKFVKAVCGKYTASAFCVLCISKPSPIIEMPF